MRYTLLCLLLAACGGGGGDAPSVDDADACTASTAAAATASIAAHGPLRCRAWVIDGDIVDGAAYPDFLIGGDA